ncbi:unnamed protein product [Ambrosiozyma monospora]|uniref:Unnamed protein product n=1 Tax=Ambrosiozyma monospora TaxID=43982 RepID=A0A9W7DK96_AMBMO|nr:unnamed protein product [Ambrosiozyma monospora]
MYIRAANRVRISRSIFSTTFFIAFSLVSVNSLVPCPVDSSMANESQIPREVREEVAADKLNQQKADQQ